MNYPICMKLPLAVLELVFTNVHHPNNGIRLFKSIYFVKYTTETLAGVEIGCWEGFSCNQCMNLFKKLGKEYNVQHFPNLLGPFILA